MNLAVGEGEFVAMDGRSGSGKSILLNILAGLDRPSSGMVRVGEHERGSLSEDDLARWRGHGVGVVFQFFQLVPTLTTIENVLLAMDFVGSVPRRQRKRRAPGPLDAVGIADQRDKLPATLSGGQQQRATIARALANDPEILVADEPTGTLDSATAEGVLALLERLVAGDARCSWPRTTRRSLRERIGSCGCWTDAWSKIAGSELTHEPASGKGLGRSERQPAARPARVVGPDRDGRARRGPRGARGLGV